MSVAVPVEAKKGLPGWAKIAIVVVLVVGAIAGAKHFHLADELPAALEWIRGRGAVGVLVYAGLYVVATLVGAAVPMTLAAGVIYGVAGGVAIVSPSSVLAATVAFLLGRFALRSSVEAKVAKNPKFAAIERAVGKHGFRIIALVRLSPVFPFTLLNYGLGVTNVKVRDYVLGSFLGMLPGTLLFVYLGHTIGDLGAILGGAKPAAAVANPDFFQAHGKQILGVVGLLATVAVTAYVTKIARAALKEELDAPPPS